MEKCQNEWNNEDRIFEVKGQDGSSEEGLLLQDAWEQWRMDQSLGYSLTDSDA